MSQAPSSLPLRSSVSNPRHRIHPTLDDLVRLQFETRDFTLLPRQPVHSLLSGRHASRLRGRGLTFEELRDYRPGDDIRSIDWRATARLRKPHVRVYSEERERPVLLVVDQRMTMFFGSARTTKATAAAEVAAMTACVHDRSRRPCRRNHLWRRRNGGNQAAAQPRHRAPHLPGTRPHQW